MPHSVSNLHEAQTVIVGVDTHKHMHVAVAIDSRGVRLGAHSFGADVGGVSRAARLGRGVWWHRGRRH